MGQFAPLRKYDKKNLFSLEQLNNRGCKTHVKDGIMKIIKGALVVIEEKKIAVNLYMLKE